MEELRTDSLSGIVLEIQRMSTEDGPGLRTTLFLKGCPLKCEWCHNPESIDPKPQIQWIESRCIGCKICVETCKQKALSAKEDGIKIDRELCMACGECVDECPSTAMELMGKKWQADELVSELLKDRSYFENSDCGGVTVSGGEVTMQTSFAEQVLKGLKQENIHTAIDTCCLCKWDSLEKLLPYVDHLLVDIKEVENNKHKQYTSVNNELILENICKLAGYLNEKGQDKKLWIRTPVIPGSTADEETIRRIAGFINEHLSDVVDRWDLCAFNNLCKDKYLRLGKNWKYFNSELLSREEMENLVNVAKAILKNPQIVQYSGSTKFAGNETVSYNKNSSCGC